MSRLKPTPQTSTELPADPIAESLLIALQEALQVEQDSHSDQPPHAPTVADEPM
jgi:hypothetical protein